MMLYRPSLAPPSLPQGVSPVTSSLPVLKAIKANTQHHGHQRPAMVGSTRVPQLENHGENVHAVHVPEEGAGGQQQSRSAKVEEN